MSLEQTIGNLEIRYANVVTFVGSSNTMVDTTTGRIQTKGIQHNSNVITDVSGPHGRVAPTLKKYPEIAFADGKFDSNESTNTYVQAGYTVSASWSQTAIVGENAIWGAFNGITSEIGMLLTNINYDNDGNANTTGTTASRLSASDSTPYGEWLKLKLPNKIKLNKYTFTSRNDSSLWSQSAEAGEVWGSDNDSDWVQLHTFTNSGFTGASQTASFNVTTNNYYKYYAFIVTKTFAAGTNQYLCIPELEYYGYEEDPPAGDHSVDTTFKSRFNNPQLTGVQVLVDGATGVGTNQISGGADPSGNQATMTSPNKYWTLNGTLTSNLSVEANTFLEGDQPHAVSVWFNSSNLEANVSNTCVFSIASEEKLDSVNLDLQSNTWHNLTYAYQGEGGSRVAYLDGRKVAEDQAEDTFGDYPPFAMTGYSQGGYVVSASGSYDTSYPAWEAFNNIWHNNGNTNGSDAWLSENATNYNGADGLYSRSPPRNLGTGALDGDWIKIEMPHKFKLDYITIYPRLSHNNKAPRDFVVYGSNDDVNWYPILTETGASITSSHQEIGHNFSMDVYDVCYKYFGLVTRKLRTDTSFVAIAELKFYGHRENDLVRLPDPTNVLKYPHIIINEPAKRGYVVSSSTEGIPPYTSGSYQAYNIFDGEIVFDGGATNTPPNGSAWISLSSKYDGSGNPTGTAASTNVTGQSPVATPGEWFQLELPHKVKLSSIRVMGQANNTTELAGRSPVDAVLAGSNDGTTWTTVLTYTGASWTTLYEFKSFPANVDSTNAYKYFRFIITKTGGQQYAALQEFEFYGTGVDSIPIQIGGGNIDKVANFRVYDKFIGEDQVNEIWNAQKEEFGRAKPQMVLQQGKLGIGTDAPQGSLSVADEPHVPGEFPPRGMTGYKNYFEGHGVFCASASSEFSDTYRAWDAFNHTGTSDSTDAWLAPMNRYTLNSYVDVDPSVAANINGVYGEWLELKLPYKITLDSLTIKSRAGSPYGQPGGAAAGNVWGSNDGVNWTLLTSFTGLTYGGVATTIGVQENVLVNSTTSYSYFRLQPTKRVGASGTDGWVGVGELRYFGTREQGQSVLHDGQLTLTNDLRLRGRIFNSGFGMIIPLDNSKNVRIAQACTGSDVSFTVPSGVSRIYVKLWGGGACGGRKGGWNYGSPGGGGGFTHGVIVTTPGETLTLIVGAGGKFSGGAAYGGGGYPSSVGYAGSGGGRSAIRRGSTELVTAGGGGGGSGTRSSGYGGRGNPGGAGGGLQGQSGIAAYDNRWNYAGGGGGQSLNELISLSPIGHFVRQGHSNQSGGGAGSQFQGGSDEHGGSGGGGWYGGGSGDYVETNTMGGGGGGSGYVGGCLFGKTMTGRWTEPANIEDIDYVPGIAYGGEPWNSGPAGSYSYPTTEIDIANHIGGDGFMVIYY